MEVELSESSIKRLSDLIGEKIINSRNTPEQWIDIDMLSEAIGLSKKTIYKYTSTTDIPCKRGRPLKFKRSDVDAWLNKR
jgi:predicted DNA-binding transcriptional regulator AlpA